MSYYELIKEVMDRYSVSARALAREAGISEATISRWKNRGSSPEHATRAAVIAALVKLTPLTLTEARQLMEPKSPPSPPRDLQRIERRIEKMETRGKTKTRGKIKTMVYLREVEAWLRLVQNGGKK